MLQETRRHIAAAASLILLTVFFVAIYYYVVSRIEKHAFERVHSVSRHTAGLLDDWLKDTTLTLGVAADLLQAKIHEQGPTALTVFSENPELKDSRLALRIGSGDIYLLNPGGLVKADRGNEAYPDWETIFSASLRSTSIEGPVPSMDGTGSEILFLHPLCDQEGKQYGLLALRVSLRQFSDKITQLTAREPVGRQFIVCSGNDLILAPVDVSGTTHSLLDNPTLAGLAGMDANNTPVIRTDFNSINKSYAKDYVASCDSIGLSGWRIFLLSPTNYELAILDVLLITFCLGWIGLCVVVFLLFYQARKYDHYKVLSELDHLTGAGNRLAFEMAMTNLRNEKEFPVSLLMMDVDGLKVYNDTLGHEAGDGLLRRTVLVLQRSLRDNDTIYRIGGDEFAVIIPGISCNSAQPLLQRITGQIVQSRQKTALPPIFVSMGLADAKAPHELTTIYSRADEAMYIYKNKHRKATREQIQKWLEDNPMHEDRRQIGKA